MDKTIVLRHKINTPELPAVPKRLLAPQEGPQTKFAETEADIAFYGGAAGGGKSYALLLEATRNVNVPGYGAVIFRRTYPEIKNEGGLWDTSMEIYPLIGSTPKESGLEHLFPGGQAIRFAHMQHEKDKLGWQGSQIPFIGWDELTHFSKGQFFYMMSRNRSTCGVKPYMRATCNPSASSWVAEFIAWWIDQETGFPIPERDGKIRWFVRKGDEIRWADNILEARLLCAPGQEPKTFTFISAKVTDNKILMEADPGYISNLHALPMFERMQLLKGNWKVRPTAGMFFQRQWFKIVEAAPVAGQVVRYWDRAATEPTERTDPDWTVGVKMLKAEDGLFYVLDIKRFRARPDGVRNAIVATASQDGEEVQQWLEQDPGQAGVAEIMYLTRALAGYQVYANKVTEKKITRAKPFSAQCEAGNVVLVRAPWNAAFLDELESFSDRDELPDELKLEAEPKDDQVDGASGAFNALCRSSTPRVRQL